MNQASLQNHGGELVDCLVTLCHLYKVDISREALISGLPLDNGKLAPSNFARAAKRAGMCAHVRSAELESINQALLPVVAILANHKACVITQIDVQTNTLEVIYPELEQGATTVSFEDFSSSFIQSVIYVRPEFHFDVRTQQINSERPKEWFWSIVKECRNLYRDVILSAFVIGLFSVAMPLFVMNIYDRVVPNAAIDTLWVLSIGVVIALVGDLIIRIVRNYFVELAASRIDVKASSRIMENVLGMKLANRPVSAGSFATSIQAFETVRTFFGAMTVVALVDLPFTLLFSLIIAFIAPPLIIPIVVAGILILSYAYSAQKKMHALSEQSMKASALRNAVLVESLNNLDELKSFNAERKTQSTWEETTVFLARISAQVRMVAASISNSASWLQQTAGVVIMVVGVHLIIENELTQGGLIAAYLLSSRALAPLAQAASMISQYHHAATALESLNEIMERPTERPTTKQWISHPVLNGSVEFKHVTFKYPDEQKEALQDVSFKIKPGERIAILGRNGSGKSTLEKLILNLYEPTSGAVFIDDIEQHQIDPAELRHNIGYVPQDVSLFYGTLKENIAIGCWQPEDERIIEVAKQVGLMDLVNHHPDGFELQVGEHGKNLSGGQRQAVALARALINDPPILLFDEPTGMLDSHAEQAILDTLTTQCQGKTLILVTHRTALLALTERIIIMDNGKVVADGAKQEVLGQLQRGEVARAS